jgi:CrcB protein
MFRPRGALPTSQSFAARSRRSTGAPRGVLLAIALGGALGAPARYELTQQIGANAGGFPWATFSINLSGAFALGVFLTVMVERFPPSRYARPFFGVGFLGAFTTYSTMAVEAVTLMKDGRAALGIGYLVGSVAAGLCVTYAGIVLGRLLPIRGAARL